MIARRSQAIRLAVIALASAAALAFGLPAAAEADPPGKLALTITSPAEGSTIGSKLVTFTGTTNDPLSELETLDPVTLWVYRGKSPAEGESPVAGPYTTFEAEEWTIPSVGPLEPGTYTAVAEQQSSMGFGEARASVTFTIDTTPPQVTLEAPANGSSTPSSTVIANGAAGTAKGDLPTVTVELYAGATAGGQAPLQTSSVPAVAGRWSTAIGGLAPGVYTVRAVQSDDAGNRGTSAPSTFSVSSPPSPQPPSASFTWFPTSPRVGETVTLVSTSTSAPSPIAGLAWDLAGSGRFSPAGPVVTTTFGKPGRQLVQLRVTNAEGLSSLAGQYITVTPQRLVLMQPFPIVRIVGRETLSGVLLSLVQVTAPINASVTVNCSGRGCPARHQTLVARAGRHRSPNGSVTVVFRRFAHSLRAGAVLQFRVTAPGEIGKYTRFTIRLHRLPARFDGCIGPTDPKPIRCPS